MSIVFWNCQGLRRKRKELQNYLLENQIDTLALNETFLEPKFKFHLPGYDIHKNDRSVGTKGGLAILVKKDIIVNQEWKNEHFNVTTNSEALAIEIELQNGDKVILATIYCPNGNPSLRLFRMINALSNQVIFLGEFNSKHKQFGCVKPNKSGQTLFNIAKDLKLLYINQLGSNRHTRDDPVHGTSDILHMAFLSSGSNRHTRDDPVHGTSDILHMAFLSYPIHKNDRSVGTKGGLAILLKKGIIVNQEWKNEHFNVKTNSEALAIEIELQNGDKVILATIYCPNGNPSLSLFRMINALSNQVIFLGEFNSKHKQFGCVKPNKSGQTLFNIAKDLKLLYINQLGSNRHTRDDPVHGTSDILHMAFLSSGLSS